MLWFDVEIKWVTTCKDHYCHKDNVVVWCRDKMSYNTEDNSILIDMVVVWCRDKMSYNWNPPFKDLFGVVVWCRDRMSYNLLISRKVHGRLWFDVEIILPTQDLERRTRKPHCQKRILLTQPELQRRSKAAGDNTLPQLKQHHCHSWHLSFYYK